MSGTFRAPGIGIAVVTVCDGLDSVSIPEIAFKSKEQLCTGVISMVAIVRTRVRDDVIPLQTYFIRTQCNGTQQSTVWVDEWNDRPGPEKLGNGSSQTTTDVVTPNFKARSARGEIFNNPFSSSKTTRKSVVTGSWGFYYVPYCTGTSIKAIDGNAVGGHSTPGSSWGGFLPGLPEWTNQVNTLRTLAGTQALANIAEPEVLGGEFLRDAARTIRLVTNPLRELQNTLKQIRRSKKFRTQKKVLGHYVAGEWLKYRYGMTPLIYDAVGAFEALYKPVFTDRKTARGYADYPKYERSDVFAGPLGAEYTASTTRYSSQHQQVRAGVLYRHVAGLEEKFGYSFNSIVPTIWEVFPGSFVGDWFVNVGDYLGAVIPKAHTQTLAQWTTVKTTHIQRAVMTSSPVAVPNLSVNGGPAMSAETERVELSRTPGVSLGLAFRSNDLTLSRSRNWLHAADAFALVGALLHSKPNRPVERRAPTRSRVLNAIPRNWVGTYDSRVID